MRAPDGKLWLWGTLRVEIIQKLFFIGSVLRTEIFQNLFKIKQNLLGEAPDGTSFIAARFAWKLNKIKFKIIQEFFYGWAGAGNRIET